MQLSHAAVSTTNPDVAFFNADHSKKERLRPAEPGEYPPSLAVEGHGVLALVSIGGAPERGHMIRWYVPLPLADIEAGKAEFTVDRQKWWDAYCNPILKRQCVRKDEFHTDLWTCMPRREISPRLYSISEPKKPELTLVKSDSPLPGAAAVFVPTPAAWTDGTDIDPRAWLYDGHYIRKFVSATIAPGGVGKSALKLVEAVSMATGKGLLTGKNTKPLRVWLWNGEDPQDETRRRAAAIYRHFGITREDLGDRLFIDSGRSVEITLAKETRGGLTIVEPVRDALIDAIKKNRIDVLIVDPFVSSHQVSENDNTKIEAVAKTFCRVAERADCAIELVHHSRKTGGAEVGAEDSRGGSALINACRQVRVINQMTKDEAGKNRVDEATRRRYFRVDDGKANLSPYSEANTWFRIESVLLGNGRPGVDQDSVGVVTQWDKPAAADGLPVNAIELAQKAIATGEWRAHVNSNEKWVGRPIAEALGMDLTSKTQKGRVADLIKEWTEAGYFKIVKRPDDNGDERPFCIIGNPWWP